MKCRFCGQELLEEAVYCNYCGKKIDEENHSISNDNNSQSANDNTKKDSNKILSRLFLIFGLIITVIYCVDGFRGTNILKSITTSIKSEKSINDLDIDEIKEEFEKYIIAQKKTLPIVIYDGATMTNFEMVGKNLVSTVVLEGALPSDYTQQIVDDIKEELLSSSVFNKDFRLLFKKCDYGVIYSYVNEYNEPLYNIHIYPHEL